MEDLASLLSALASLAWPLVFAALLIALFNPIKNLIQSAVRRKFSVKVAGNELTMEEASEIQGKALSDLQSAVASLERRMAAMVDNGTQSESIGPSRVRRILWVDDYPKNNAYLVALLEQKGIVVDTALSTDEAVARFRTQPYDVVISDMGRSEGNKAGIDLLKHIRVVDAAVPFFIFCSARAALAYRSEALAEGATEITSSSTTLLSRLPIGNS